MDERRRGQRKDEAKNGKSPELIINSRGFGRRCKKPKGHVAHGKDRYPVPLRLFDSSPHLSCPLSIAPTSLIYTVE